MFARSNALDGSDRSIALSIPAAGKLCNRWTFLSFGSGRKSRCKKVNLSSMEVKLPQATTDMSWQTAPIDQRNSWFLCLELLAPMRIRSHNLDPLPCRASTQPSIIAVRTTKINKLHRALLLLYLPHQRPQTSRRISNCPGSFTC